MAQRTQVMSHVTRHTHNTSHTTPHTQHLTHNTSHTTPHTEHLTHNTSHTTPHTHHLTQNTSHTTPDSARPADSKPLYWLLAILEMLQNTMLHAVYWRWVFKMQPHGVFAQVSSSVRSRKLRWRRRRTFLDKSVLCHQNCTTLPGLTSSGLSKLLCFQNMRVQVRKKSVRIYLPCHRSQPCALP